MDLRLLAEGTSFRLVPASVHGILWLQTHFESEHWELLQTDLSPCAEMTLRGSALMQPKQD